MQEISISVELLAIAIPALIFVAWLFWFNLSNKYYKRRYKIENDKGRPYKRIDRAKQQFSNGIANAKRNSNIREPSILQTPDIVVKAETDSDRREASNSNGKISKPRRNPFRRKD